MSVPAVKICGVTRRSDAEGVAHAGTDFIGVILAPGYRRSVSARSAAAMLASLPVRRVGVFVDAPLGDLLEAAAVASLDVLQLHGDESEEYVTEARSRSGATVWKAIRPRSGHEFQALVSRYAASADGLLVDSWAPHARGGSGVRFAWDAVGTVRDAVPESRKLIVAGGLDHTNVAAAVELLRPHVVDVSSGVESAPGIKDLELVARFVHAARGGATLTTRGSG